MKFPPDGHPYFPPPYLPQNSDRSPLALWLALIALVVLA